MFTHDTHDILQAAQRTTTSTSDGVSVLRNAPPDPMHLPVGH